MDSKVTYTFEEYLNCTLFDVHRWSDYPEVLAVRKDILESYGVANNVVKQLIDLALLANNMLRGEELSTFVKRSVDLL